MVDKVIEQYHFIDPCVELIRHNEIPATVLEWIEGTTLDNINITEEVAEKFGEWR